jgi:hypothetical protein
LNTNDIFLLNTSEKQYIWLGSNSDKFMVIPETTLVELGNSIKVFCSALIYLKMRIKRGNRKTRKTISHFFSGLVSS